MSFMYKMWKKPTYGYSPCVLGVIFAGQRYSGTVHPVNGISRGNRVIERAHFYRTNAMKAEKYIISTEGVENPVTIIRMGYGIAGEEVQKFLSEGVPRIRIRVVGPEKETIISQDRVWRLLDIKQRIKNLTSDDY